MRYNFALHTGVWEWINECFRGAVRAVTTTADATTAAAGAIGVKSGQVIAGEIGSGSFGYTAIGENVGMARGWSRWLRRGDAQRVHGAAVCCWKRPTKSRGRVTVSGMAGMDVYVSEGDVRRYAAETLPRHKRSDWVSTPSVATALSRW